MFDNRLNRWWTVLGGAMGAAVGIGVIGNAFGIFTQPIAAEFGWQRSQVTLGLSVLHIFSGIGEITLGAIMLRWGIRRPAILLVALCSIAIACLGLLPKSLPAYYLLYGVVGFCGAAATPLPYAVAICSWFDDKRGLALGVMVTGTGLGASLIPILSNHLLRAEGWRGGFIGLGLLMGVVSLFALLVLVRVPRPEEAAVQDVIDSADVPTFVQIFTRYPSFWQIGLPIFLTSLIVTGIMSNIVPIMTDRGVSEAHAVGMLSIAGLASWVSRILVGVLLDRVFAPYVAAGAMLVSGLGLVIILLAPGNLAAAYFAAMCVGFSLGGEGDLVTFLVSRYFRPAIFSKVVGAVWILWAWGNSLGISVASFAHDETGSYNPAIWGFVVASVVSALIVASLKAYPYPVGDRRAAMPTLIPGEAV